MLININNPNHMNEEHSGFCDDCDREIAKHLFDIADNTKQLRLRLCDECAYNFNHSSQALKNYNLQLILWCKDGQKEDTYKLELLDDLWDKLSEYDKCSHKPNHTEYNNPHHTSSSIEELYVADINCQKKLDVWSNTPEGIASQIQFDFGNFIMKELKLQDYTIEDLSTTTNIPLHLLKKITLGDVNYSVCTQSQILHALNNHKEKCNG